MSGAPDRLVFSTDTGTLALFDPARVKHRVRSPRSWWDQVRDGDYAKLEDVRAERICIWPLGGKGGRYSVRLRAGELAEAERPFVRGSVSGLAVVVESGHIFVGPGERIPGDGFGDRIVTLEDGGGLVPCAPGRYGVTVHVLDWKGESTFFDEDGEPRPDAPTDLVVLLGPPPDPPAPPRPIPSLLDFLPKPPPPRQVSTGAVVRAVASRPRVEVGRPAATRGSGARKKKEEAEWHPAPDPEPPPRPGEIRVGMRVRHASHGEGTVLFIREGFPKVKVDFRGAEIKCDRSELEPLP